MGKQSEYVIIGNGIAGVTAAETLRTEDATCLITIIADEPFPVYYRPALKDYLGGHVPEEKLWARPSTFYKQQHIRFMSARVVAIHPTQHKVQLSSGQYIDYSKLLLAHGAQAHKLTCPGVTLAGVSTLRTVADYQQVVQRLQTTQRIVVCGSGTLALESAETLAHQGYEVTHLLRHETLWSDVLDSTASDMVLQEERRLGIDVQTNEEIAEILGENGQVQQVVTTHGKRIPCGIVLIAIGIQPNIDFVRQSGIACGYGIKIDAAMHTNMPDIYAAGDVVETTDALTGKTRVIGQWYPAIQQAQTAAYAMLYEGTQDLHSSKETEAFYNATFLCGLDFVSIGVTAQPPHGPLFQEIIAPPGPRSYRKVLLHHGIPVGLLFLGERKNALGFKRAIAQRISLAPVLHRLFADDFSLDEYLDAQQEVDALLVPIPHPEIVVELVETRLTFDDGNERITIGRSPDATVNIHHRSVSRQHAEILQAHNEQYAVRDIASSNGTFLNDVRLLGKNVHSLQPKDILRFGDIQFRFETRKATADAHDKQRLHVAGMTHRTNVHMLAKEQVQFELDMCIGCDRCMRVCPVPLSSQVSIADLNSATATPDVAPHVARFTHECVMCGSCVPVCPVDNHRDLLMLSLKQRLGPSWQERPEPDSLTHVVPAGWTLPLLLARLRAQRVFTDDTLVPDNYLLHLLASSHLHVIRPGEYVFREGEYGRDLYCILEGSIAQSMTDEAGMVLPIALHAQGECIGEYGMLTGQQYATTASAQVPTLLLRIPEQAIQRLMELAPGVRSRFEQVNRGHSTLAILKQMALFQGISDADMQYLFTQSRIQHYERNAPLFTEGHSGRPARETLHILLEGFVKVARRVQEGHGNNNSNERIIAYRQGGDYFAGGLDLLGDGRAVTVTSINRTRVAEVPHQAVQVIFQRYPEVKQRFALRLRDYITSTVTLQTDILTKDSLKHLVPVLPQPESVRAQGLHALVNDGVVEGTEVLLIDLDKCIHCNECEEACERRHGHSRMNRKGMVIGNISIATACRQCQDPVCLLCSRAGIARLPDGEVYITESCIGCGICAERCPYGAISIVDADEGNTRDEQSSWQRFRAIFTQGIVKERKRPTIPVLNGVGAFATGSNLAVGPLTPPRDAIEELRKKIAIKCDLCAGYKDQACVEACPTGAAIRVQPTAFFGSTEEILQR